MDNAKKNESYIDEDVRYFPLIPTPFGMIPLVGATMTTDRECELFGKEVQTERMTIDKSGNGCGSSRPEVRRRKPPSRLSSLKNKRRNFK